MTAIWPPKGDLDDKWRLINDEPWKRAYVVFKKGANTRFVPDAK
jgi:hypothetical protein